METEKKRTEKTAKHTRQFYIKTPEGWKKAKAVYRLTDGTWRRGN